MKLLILSRYGHLGASSRLRTEQYLPYLREAGFEVITRPLLDDAYLAQSYQGKASRWRAIKGLATRAKVLLEARRYDLIWIEKEALPWCPYFIERLLLPTKVPYVLDYDDAVFHQYDMNRRAIVRKLLGRKLDNLMRGAAAVFVGNDYLAARASKAKAKEIVYVPTVLDKDHYTLKTKESFMNQVPSVIGWIGSPSTWRMHMFPLLPVLQTAASRSESTIQIIGAKPEFEVQGSVQFIPWSEQTEGKITAGFTVGVMPLSDDPWSQGKCGYKLLQYMASGIPVIASPVGVNSQIVIDGANGFSASSDDDWLNSLESILGNPTLAFDLGREGREKVEREYSIQVWGAIVADKLKQLATSKPTKS